jgi:hypothetical protein
VYAAAPPAASAAPQCRQNRLAAGSSAAPQPGQLRVASLAVAYSWPPSTTSSRIANGGTASSVGIQVIT